jgi:hypothetical protein
MDADIDRLARRLPGRVNVQKRIYTHPIGAGDLDEELLRQLLELSFLVQIDMGTKESSGESSIYDFLGNVTQRISLELARKWSFLTAGRRAYADAVKRNITSIAGKNTPEWLDTDKERETIETWLSQLVELPVRPETSLTEL